MAGDEQQEFRALQAAGWLAAYFGYADSVADARVRFAERGIVDDTSAMRTIIWMMNDQQLISADQMTLALSEL